MSSFHQPVLLDQAISYLKPQLGGSFIDCTLGGAGHTIEILRRVLPGGKILGIDLDPIALKAAGEELKNYSSAVLVRDNFRNLKKIALKNNFKKVDGILFDLGLSSAQLLDHSRGFSFLAEGGLDMRFGHSASSSWPFDLTHGHLEHVERWPRGRQSEMTAEKILNTYRQKELFEIFKNFGQERLAKPIAERIVQQRKLAPIKTPGQLVEIVSEIYKKFYREKSKINPATKIFQALRIAVNQELENLTEVLPQAIELLKKGGRLAVISYHSLEDRIVKDFFRQESKDCLCPPELPTCRCFHKKTLKIITKKPVAPAEEEILVNPRSRSAKLRVAEKI